MSKVHFNNDYTGCDEAIDTTRKSAAIAKSFVEHPTEGIEITDPRAATRNTETLIRILHRLEYVDAVRTGKNRVLAESQGFKWDPGIYSMAVSHNSGLVAATDAVLLDGERWSGSTSSGLHHATAASGHGYCTFNGLAVAAQRAHDHGAERILVLDFDAHCGGGTYGMTRHLDLVQIDVSTSAFDVWHADVTDTESMLTLTGPEDYLPTIKRALDKATALGSWDFVLYNAGMDPINTGVSESVLKRREQMVAAWCAQHNVPTVATVAGGYTWGDVTMEQLVRLHRMTFEQFAAAG